MALVPCKKKAPATPRSDPSSATAISSTMPLSCEVKERSASGRTRFDHIGLLASALAGFSLPTSRNTALRA
eukprot:tig00000241_g20968.t2